MCGIAGIISYQPDRVLDREVKRMQKALIHRGPDGQGQNHDPRVKLSMRRLAIIDVAGGNQPLFNETGSVEIVGNGEIYNYLEIQANLKRKGHKFQSGSDIETVVHLYEEEGIGCVTKLRGMFALALYDVKKQRVYLIRDRLGEKPLYYHVSKEAIFFASEMKSLLTTNKIRRDLNWDGIFQYLHLFYIPEPDTMLDFVQKVPPGCWIEIDVDKKTIRENPYWNSEEIRPRQVKNLEKNILETFSQACELTLRSDVPVGIALSGGIDSGSILALSAPKYRSNMKAFCVGYEDNPASDERQLAKMLAKKFKVEFIEGEIKTKDVVDYFPYLVWESDDPIADIAGQAIFTVSHLARKHKVPVLLGGIGGDELFWGYPSTVNAVKQSVINLTGWRKYFSSKRLVYNNPNPEERNYFGEISSNNFKARINPEYFSQILSFKGEVDELKIAKKSLGLLRSWWLVSNCIALNDRLSMASSIELRSPFLDYKLVETILSSSQAILAYQAEPKFWLKKAMKGILPDEVLRRPKQGFTPPIGKWLCGIMNRYMSLVDDGFLVQNQIVDPQKWSMIKGWWKQIPNKWYACYQLILLEIWGREYIWNINPEDIG